MLKEDVTGLTETGRRALGIKISEVRELHAFRDHKWRLTSRETFFREGVDAATAYFFKKFKARRARTTLKKIKKEDGQIISTPAELKTEVYRLQQENRSGSIKPFRLGDHLTASVACLADDTAIFMEVDHRSWDNLFLQLALLEKVSGARVNRTKSKLLIIGKTIQFPEWATEAGVQRVDTKNPPVYLRALAMTTRKGVDDSDRILSKVYRSAQYYSAFRLPLESRVIACKGAVFPTLIYPLMTAVFKKGTFKKLDVALRRYIWTTNTEGKDKTHLAAWILLNVPKEVGGLGIFQLHQFQGALMCRALLRIMEKPLDSLWGQVLATQFLKVDPIHLAKALCTRELPGPANLGPVSALMLRAWSEFFSNLRWSPTNRIQLPDTYIAENLFLICRMWWSIGEAKVVARDLTRRCRQLGLNSVLEIRHRMMACPGIICSATNVLERKVLTYINDNEFFYTTGIVAMAEWKAEGDGTELQTFWKTSRIYSITGVDRFSIQGRVMSDRTGLSWTNQEWQSVWAVTNGKNLSQRHSIFLWRVVTDAFMTGKKRKEDGTGFILLFVLRWRCRRFNTRPFVVPEMESLVERLG
ncbi:hypothetical protein R1sor_002914 [Riccia sorocarpa]|uniref:Reverse transcriptase zinc-binding domain-containing protein n=1 Tax=Riccia sorocarpa TaxID=122646 RepID=A0ABD3H380_9MARC